MQKGNFALVFSHSDLRLSQVKSVYYMMPCLHAKVQQNKKYAIEGGRLRGAGGYPQIYKAAQKKQIQRMMKNDDIFITWLYWK